MDESRGKRLARFVRGNRRKQFQPGHQESGRGPCPRLIWGGTQLTSDHLPLMICLDAAGELLLERRKPAEAEAGTGSAFLTCEVIAVELLELQSQTTGRCVMLAATQPAPTLRSGRDPFTGSTVGQLKLQVSRSTSPNSQVRKGTLSPLQRWVNSRLAITLNRLAKTLNHQTENSALIFLSPLFKAIPPHLLHCLRQFL